MIDSFTIHPLTPDRFHDFETVLGRGGISGCWCMYWLTDTSAAFEAGRRGGSKGANRSAFHALSRKQVPGLLAYDGDEPAGWVRILPRALHPGLARSRLYPPQGDESGVWSISCFVIRKPWRGQGLSALLILAAVDHARTAGAKAVEAYPADVTGQKSPMALYRGRASTFRRAGFAEIARPKPDKPLMRLSL